ncbi:MAG: hypothetical protein WAO98_04100 [Alphaproteobacteria bacterium]
MAEEQKTAEGNKKGGKAGFILLMILFGLSVPFMMPTYTLLLIGMFPTFIALLTDTDKNHSSASAIGFMNAAGTTPFVIDLWMKGQTMEYVFHILREPSNWLVMLGAAGIGQLIVFAVPQAMTSVTLARAEIRLKTLKSNLEQLKAAWGPEVATTKPVDKIIRGG